MRVITTTTANANAMRVQNSPAPASVGRNRLRTEYHVGGAKYGNSCVAKNQLRDAGDIRKSANRHCTATKLASVAAPSVTACVHVLHAPVRRRSRSNTIAGTITSVPKRMAVIPRASKMCGGLRILTSSPYAPCHQLSNGADVIMATPPHAQMNAPSGPRNPHIEIDTSRSGEFFRSVVERIR